MLNELRGRRVFAERSKGVALWGLTRKMVRPEPVLTDWHSLLEWIGQLEELEEGKSTR